MKSLRLKGSKEEIIFHEEPIETPTGPMTETPSLVLDGPSSNSTSELLLDKGELTGSVFGHGLPVGVSPGPYVTPVLPTLATQLDMASMASSQCRMTPRPLFSTMHKLFSGKVDSYWAIGVHQQPSSMADCCKGCTVGDKHPT